jgi:hypothetical protein
MIDLQIVDKESGHSVLFKNIQDETDIAKCIHNVEIFISGLLVKKRAAKAASLSFDASNENVPLACLVYIKEEDEVPWIETKNKNNS